MPAPAACWRLTRADLPAACCCLLCPLLQGAGQLAWVIAANEEMARFMILADACLADQDKVRGMNASAAPAHTQRTIA